MQRSPQVIIYTHARPMPADLLKDPLCGAHFYYHEDKFRVATMWHGDEKRYFVRIDVFQNEKDLDQ